MTDIVERLRDRVYGSKFPDLLLEEAADEIVALRNGALSGCETVRPVKDVDPLKQRVAELLYAKEQLELRVLDLVMTRAKNALVTLTDAEREAIGWAIELLDAREEAMPTVTGKFFAAAATLRGLLERLK